MSKPTAVATRRALVVVWLGAAVLAAGLLGVVHLFRQPTDSPDPAYQRPGILDLAALPEPAAPVTPQVPGPGRRAVVFFERPDRLAALCSALPGTGLNAIADLVIVVSSQPLTGCGATPVVVDPVGLITDAYDMPTPIDGGPPIGYAVVDAQGLIRYRTLAPEISELYEVSVMLGAL